jgi:hypothetical protein
MKEGKTTNPILHPANLIPLPLDLGHFPPPIPLHRRPITVINDETLIRPPGPLGLRAHTQIRERPRDLVVRREVAFFVDARVLLCVLVVAPGREGRGAGAVEGAFRGAAEVEEGRCDGVGGVHALQELAAAGYGGAP